MSLSGKVVTRVFQLCLRNNVIKCRQKSCSYILRRPANLLNTYFKPVLIDRRLVSDLSTKTVRSRSGAMGALSPLDPSSYSRPELAVIKHISLSLNVDFEKHVLSGEATLNFDILEDINELILDTSNIKIESIEEVGGSQLQYKLGDTVPNFGSKLTILLPKQAASGEKKDEPTLKKSNIDARTAIVVNDMQSAPSTQSSEIDLPSSKSTTLFYDDDNNIYQPCSEVFHLKYQSDVSVTTEYAAPSVRKPAETQTPIKRDMSIDTCSVCSSCLDPDIVVKQREKCMSCETMPVCNFETHCSPECCNDECTFAVYRGNRIKIRIKYSTDPTASALQWLDASQTSGKKHPYLFSQCQPIHARSILPCQDTPAVKFTYDAEVSAPEEFTVLMSALRGDVRANKTTFNQPMPLPSYLVAIAVGVLESRPLGPRSKVWSEKEEIERSAWEFAETEKYLQAAEKLCGPYEWTQYDLLVLPPSFPYGGMENPCLTFVTPTLLAGDRSQADVIVHEIMHSWTGNLVTNRNFEHFWLNEGFTVFLERKVGASLINDSVEAKRSRDFHSLLGLQELTEAVDHFGASNPLTNLVVDLNGIHPDDAFSRVPYEKGSLFLRYLEDLVGGPEVFDDFLRSYLTKYRKKSLDTDQFKEFLLNYFKDNDKLKNFDWDSWLYTSGMPPAIPDYDTTMTKAISALIAKLGDPQVTFLYDDVKSLTPHQIIHFLQQLIERPALPLEQLRAMGTEYKIDGNKNTEIWYRWLRLCAKSKDESKISEIFTFLNSNGRMKYVRPLYRDMYAWEDARNQTIQNFLQNEKNMMHVTAYTLKKDLHLID